MHASRTIDFHDRKKMKIVETFEILDDVSSFQVKKQMISQNYSLSLINTFISRQTKIARYLEKIDMVS